MNTPGPWHTDKTKSFYVFACGSLAEQAGAQHGPFVANASTAANARLIAAAPDLLSALQAVADYWAGGDVPPEIDAQMRAAIARATSED